MADWIPLAWWLVPMGLLVVLVALACRARSMDLDIWQQEEEAAYAHRRQRLAERLEASRRSVVPRAPCAPHAWPGVAFRQADADGYHRT